MSFLNTDTMLADHQHTSNTLTHRTVKMMRQQQESMTINVVYWLKIILSSLLIFIARKEELLFRPVDAAIIVRKVSRLCDSPRLQSLCARRTQSELVIISSPTTKPNEVIPNTNVDSQQKNIHHHRPPQLHRRAVIQTMARFSCHMLPWMTTIPMITLASTTTTSTTAQAATSTTITTDTERILEMNNDSIIQITLTDPSVKLGLQLSNRLINTASSPATTSDMQQQQQRPSSSSTMTMVVYVERIVSPSDINANLREGMILLGYDNAKTVQEILLQPKSYPITLSFQKSPSPDVTTTENDIMNTYRIVTISPTCRSSSTDDTSNETVPPPSRRSQRGDVLGIIYEAHIGSPTGRIYDTSYQRGTGQQPYQMVLGSGDMILGVDQGLYDMCLDEIRGIYIPSRLGYNTRGNRMFQIPPNTNLYWQVQLVRID
jgi:hypothetical protein